MRRLRKHSSPLRTLLLTGVCLSLLGGCSWLEDWPPGNRQASVQRAAPPPSTQTQSSKIMKTADGTWMEPSSTASAVPVEPIQAKGLVVSEGDMMERIAELEMTVSTIQNDLSMMMPALTKIAEAQGDLQNLIGRIEPAAGGYEEMQRPPTQRSYQQPVSTGNNVSRGAPVSLNQGGATQGSLPPISVPSQNTRQQQNSYQQAYNSSNNTSRNSAMASQYARQQQPQPAQQQYAPPPSQQYSGYQQQGSSYGGGGTNAVYDIRFGEHPGKTRMVLDLSDKAAFRYDIDNNERILMVEMPGTAWGGAAQNMVQNSPLVQSYMAMPDGQGGTQLAIQLKQPAAIQWADSLASTGGKNSRLVFDIVPL